MSDKMKEYHNKPENPILINAVTLRDYFAGKALIGVISRLDGVSKEDDVARWSYE